MNTEELEFVTAQMVLNLHRDGLCGGCETCRACWFDCYWGA
jgi:hypothetical protein